MTHRDMGEFLRTHRNTVHWEESVAEPMEVDDAGDDPTGWGCSSTETYRERSSEQ